MFAENISPPHVTDKNPATAHVKTYDGSLKRTAESIYTIAHVHQPECHHCYLEIHTVQPSGPQHGVDRENM